MKLLQKLELNLAIFLMKKLRCGVPILSIPEHLIESPYERAIFELSQTDREAAIKLDAYFSFLLHILPLGYTTVIDFSKSEDGFCKIKYTSGEAECP